MTDYVVKTYETAAFYVEGGMYTIEELEQMITEFVQAKEIQDSHLEKALGIKE